MTKKQRQTMSESRCSPRGEAHGTPEESLLSPRRAFVVQFREEMDATPGCCSGRVEHLVSGHAARFHSPQELWAFFKQILSAVHD
jgi:hypothetical protein